MQDFVTDVGEQFGGGGERPEPRPFPVGARPIGVQEFLHIGRLGEQVSHQGSGQRERIRPIRRQIASKNQQLAGPSGHQIGKFAIGNRRPTRRLGQGFVHFESHASTPIVATHPVTIPLFLEVNSFHHETSF